MEYEIVYSDKFNEDIETHKSKGINLVYNMRRYKQIVRLNLLPIKMLTLAAL